MATNQFGQTYTGNDDYRGYLLGNGYARYLDYVGNDGNFNQNKYNADTANSAMLNGGNPTNMGLINPNQNSQLYQNWVNARQPKAPDIGGGQIGDAATAGYYDDQTRALEGQLGRLDGQLATGLGNITSSYNKGLNRLDQQRAVAERDYGTNKKQNVTGYLDNRNGIMQNTRSQSNALQRLLGLSGSGYSSAALEAAPYAAALQGSQSLNKAQGTYRDNESALATAWDDTMRSYDNSREDLKDQKYQQENSLRASIAQTRAGLLDQISQGKIQAGMARGQDYASAAAGRGDYQRQIDSLLDQITGLGKLYSSPVLRAGNISYSAPDQGQFTLDKFAAPTNLSGGASDLSPTFLGLLTGRRDEYGNPVGY